MRNAIGGQRKTLEVPVMPKLKVPSDSAKAVKKPLTSPLVLKRRPLHSPNADLTPEKNATSQAAMETSSFSSQPLGCCISGVPPSNKQNGLKRVCKSFEDVFGNSDDEVRCFFPHSATVSSNHFE